MIRSRIRTFICFGALVSIMVSLGSTTSAQTLPSGTPQKFEPTNYGFEYTRREVMIPMRDGVKLHTVIVVPKGAKRAPIRWPRTPSNATELTIDAASSHLGPIL